MKKLICLLLTVALLLSIVPLSVSASASGPFGWSGDTSDFSPWTAENGAQLRIDASNGGNRRLWKPVVTDRNNFSVRLSVTIHTGRAYVSLMGLSVELNASGGGGNMLYTNIGTQWFNAGGCSAELVFVRQGGGDIYLTICGSGNDIPVTAVLTPTDNSADLILGTYEKTASATFSDIRAFCGGACGWLPVSGLWQSTDGGIFTDNNTGTHARIYGSNYFSGEFELSFDMDFEGFYKDNRICSQRIGLSSNAFDGVSVLYDVMIENNGKSNISLSWLNGNQWVSAGQIPWDNSDSGRHSNRYTVKITRAGNTLSFALIHTDDGSVVSGAPLTITQMPKSQLDGYHTVTVEAYNGKGTYSDIRISSTPETGALQAGWQGDTAAFSSGGNTSILAHGDAQRSAWRAFSLPQTQSYAAAVSVPFGIVSERREVSLTNASGEELFTVRIEKDVTGTAEVSAWRGGSRMDTVPQTNIGGGWYDTSRTLKITRLDGKNTLLVSWGGKGFETAPLDGLDTAGGLRVLADTPAYFTGISLQNLALPQPVTNEDVAGITYTGLWNGDSVPVSAAQTAYENLMKNYLDADNDRFYPVEGGFTNGTVTNTGVTVSVARAGELWEPGILSRTLETYALMFPEGSPTRVQIFRRIANTINFFLEQYTFEELTTPACAPVNHAMDDCSWNISTLTLGYLCNAEIGNAAQAQSCLDAALTLFANTYDFFYDDELCVGTWYNKSKTGKSLYAAMLALDGWDLYEITGDPVLLAKAMDVYNGIENNLRRADGLYWCDLTYAGFPGIKTPYGIREAGSVSFLGGNMAMAVLNARLGNPDKARQTAAGISLYQTNELGVYFNDRDAWVNTVFLGQWTRELLNTGVLGEEYCKTLRETAYSVLEYATLDDGYYSAAWSGPKEPSADGYPMNYSGEKNPWGNSSNTLCNGSVPKQMTTSATTAHIIFAAAAIDCPTEPHKTYAADLFGWQSDSGDLSGWTAQTEYDLSGSFAHSSSHRIWKNYIQDQNDLAVSLNITVNTETSAYLRLLGVTLELDGRNGNGQQAFLKLAGENKNWLSGADGCFHIEIVRTSGGDLTFTVTGKGNGSVSFSGPAAEQNEYLELGVYAGEAAFRRLMVDSGASVHTHVYEESSSAPTCTQPGQTVRTCVSCGVTETETVPALGHDYANGVCTRCGEADPEAGVLKISSAYLHIDEDINVIFAASVPAGCTAPYMVFNFRGNETVVRAYTVDADGRYCFEFTRVMPQCMGDSITATLYAKKDGVTVCDTVDNYSVRSYCEHMLASSGDAKLNTLLSDLLTYGAAAQNYTGYKTSVLVTDGLDLTPSTFAPIDAQRLSFSGEQSTAADWDSVTLGLGNDVAMRFVFTAESTDGLSVDVNINGRTQTFTEFASAGDGKFAVMFRGIKATEFDDAVTASFKLNGAPAGRTVIYSVNAYISAAQSSPNTTLKDLVQALCGYGASAKAYSWK